jgi:hypothetical protein
VIVEVPVGRHRSVWAALRATIALTILTAFTAASLACLASLVFSLAVFDAPLPARIVDIVAVTLVTAAVGYLITRMARRRDLSVAYRASWICLPVLAVGVLSVFAIAANTPVI